MEARILCYTREPMDDAVYAEKLAYSMHLAVETRDGYVPLNHNEGVLYVKAISNPDGTLVAKSLLRPYLFNRGTEGFWVLAERTEADGTTEAGGPTLVLFAGTDLLAMKEIGCVRELLSEGEPAEKTASAQAGERGLEDAAKPVWQAGGFSRKKELADAVEDYCAFYREGREIGKDEESGSIFGCVPGNQIEISKELAGELVNRLTTPVNVGIELPEGVCVSSAKELLKVTVIARYSDGSTAGKQVDWKFDGIDFSKQGTIEVKGRVRRPHFAFPLAINRADPCVGRWNGKYYFIATNDADNNHTLYIREADTLAGLVDAKEVLLLDSLTYPGIGGLLWAPEFHVVDGELYIFHAATPGEFFWEESHVMALRHGGDPMNPADWSAPRRVVKKDGSELCEAGKVITLDMTCFEHRGSYYAVWSQRQFLPVDQGAWLYIATVNPKEPWRLSSEPVLLSKPEFGWANNHTFVDEGPFALLTDKKVFLTFSSAAVDSTYVVGLLSAEPDADLLNPASWEKKNFPILTSRCVEGEYGTGHNAYVIDDNGDVWNTYHARPGIDGPRSSGFRRVHFNAAGEPVLDVTEEKDVAEAFRDVTLRVEIKK